MAHSTNILQELREMGSLLVDHQSEPVYTVPEGYFTGLVDEVLMRIKAMENQGASDEIESLSPLIAGITRKMPYDIPSDFFDSVNKQVFQSNDKLSAKEELEIISPLLSSLEKALPYTVPKGYFEKAIAAPSATTKVISLTGRKWFKYAAAAAMITAAATTIFVISTKDKIDPATNSYTWVEKKMKKVSTDDIENFVSLADETLPGKDAIASVKTNEVQDMIKDIPVSDIQEFLSEIPQDDSNGDDEAIMN